MDFLRSPQEATSEESVIGFFCFWLSASPFKGDIWERLHPCKVSGNVQLTMVLLVNDLVLYYGDLKRKNCKKLHHLI